MAVDAAERRRVLVAVALGSSLAPFMVSGLVVLVLLRPVPAVQSTRA